MIKIKPSDVHSIAFPFVLFHDHHIIHINKYLIDQQLINTVKSKQHKRGRRINDSVFWNFSVSYLGIFKKLTGNVYSEKSMPEYEIFCM